MVESAYDENVADFCDKSNHFLKIPELQREFVWEEKNVKTLLRDMKFHQNNSDDLGNMFLGPIIIHYNKTLHHNYEGVIPQYSKLIDSESTSLDELKEIAKKLFPDESEDCERSELEKKIENKRERSGLIDGQQRITILTILSRVLYSKFGEDTNIAKSLYNVFTHTSGELRLNHNHTADGQDYKSIFDHHDDWCRKKKLARSTFNDSKKEVDNLVEIVEQEKVRLEEVYEGKNSLAEDAKVQATGARAQADIAGAAGAADANDLDEAAEAAEAEAEALEIVADAAKKAAESAEKASTATNLASKDIDRIIITTKKRTVPNKVRSRAIEAEQRSAQMSTEAETAKDDAINATGTPEEPVKMEIASLISSAADLARYEANATEATAKAAEAAEEASINWSNGKQEWPESKNDNYFRLAYDVINDWVEAIDTDERNNADEALADAKRAEAEATGAKAEADAAQEAGAANADDLAEAAEAADANATDARTAATQAVEDADKAQLEELEEFSSEMIEMIEFVTIQISNDKQVHLAFRSLNSLGKELTNAEKVKNELFSFATLGGDDNATKQNWQRLVAGLKPLMDKDRKAIDDFLFVYCRSKGITRPPSRRTQKLSNKDVHSVFTDPKTPMYYQNHNQTETGLYDANCFDDVDGLLTPNHEKVANFTLELAEYAEGYAKIRNPSVLSGAPYGVQNEQVNEIVDLSKIFSAQLRPYFLAAFMNTIGQTEIMGLNANAQKTRMINERAKFKKLIVAVSTAAVRLAICKKKPTFRFEHDINRWVGYIANDSFNAAIIKINDEVKGMINLFWAEDGPPADIGNPGWVSTVDDNFEEYLSDELILSTPSGGPDINKAKYLIRGCEGVRRWGAAKPLFLEYYSPEVYTVEHILPKSVINKWKPEPGARKGGDWGREWEVHDARLPERNRAWPEDKKEMKELRFRLGNHLLLEARVNSKALARTWSGQPLHLPRTTVAPPEPNPQWGKYHIFWSLQWWETDELAEQEDAAEMKTGSHLKCVKDFCELHRAEVRWTKELLIKRGEKLAKLAKEKKEWKLW